MKFIAIIPARYASTRFPGKPLALLGGKTVIQRVYEQASAILDEAYVATDDERIYQAVEAFGGKAVMTRTDHKSGTDRLEEAASKIGTDADVIINIQGDEPFIQQSQITTLMQLFDDPTTQIGTLGKPFESMEAVENPIPVLDLIKAKGVRTCLTINPDIDVKRLVPYLDKVDMILLMSVFAGFGGQKFIPETMDKIRFINDS